jgi:hypothetical protein
LPLFKREKFIPWEEENWVATQSSLMPRQNKKQDFEKKIVEEN